MRTLLLTACLAALPVLPAVAQIGNPGFMAPDTRMEAPARQAPNQTNTADRLFAQLVAQGGKAEVAFGKLAAEKAKASDAAGFARRMIEDHTKAGDELAAIAGKSKIPLPEGPGEQHVTMLEQLKALDGAAFDLTYMRGQVVEHQKTTQLLIWEINSGQDPELKRFAAEVLPTILDHLATARAIIAELAQAQIAQATPRVEK